MKCKNVTESFHRLQPKLRFIPWNNEGWKIGLCETPAVGTARSLLSLANNTCIHNNFSTLRGHFLQLYSRKVSLISSVYIFQNENENCYYCLTLDRLIYTIILKSTEWTNKCLKVAWNRSMNWLTITKQLRSKLRRRVSFQDSRFNDFLNDFRNSSQSCQPLSFQCLYTFIVITSIVKIMCFFSILHNFTDIFLHSIMMKPEVLFFIFINIYTVNEIFVINLSILTHVPSASTAWLPIDAPSTT